MPRRPTRQPTAAEMEILVLLWRDGPLTPGEVQERLGKRRRTGYTTALKLLQVMLAKGLVQRDESERAHRYEAVAREAEVQQSALAALADQLFSGSVAELVMRAISATRPSPSERSEIRRTLDARKRRGSTE